MPTSAEGFFRLGSEDFQREEELGWLKRRWTRLRREVTQHRAGTEWPTLPGQGKEGSWHSFRKRVPGSAPDQLCLERGERLPQSWGAWQRKAPSWNLPQFQVHGWDSGARNWCLSPGLQQLAPPFPPSLQGAPARRGSVGVSAGRLLLLAYLMAPPPPRRCRRSRSAGRSPPTRAAHRAGLGPRAR